MNKWLLLLAFMAAAAVFTMKAPAQQSNAYKGSVQVATALATEDTAGVTHGVASWSELGFGNHRAVVQVANATDAVFVRLPWRRQDFEPHKKAVVVFDGKAQRVLNVVRGKIDREAGEIAFQPVSGPGEYFIYFMPNGKLASLDETAGADWLKANGLPGAAGDLAGAARRLPAAAVLRFESKSDFDRRDPMELIATAQETETLLARHPHANYLVFPEDRRDCVRMFNDLPYRWIRRGPTARFAGQASPDEYYAFQIGVYACRKAIANVRLQMSDLQGPANAVIPAKSVRCINGGGIDWVGRRFEKPISVGLRTVKPLWFVVEVPEKATAGIYRGTVKLLPAAAGGEDLAATEVALEITVNGDPVPYHGCLDSWRMSRLGWLDSTKGEDDTVIAPYLPVEWRENVATILNRRVKFNALGFPEQITAGDHELLAAPIAFSVQGELGSITFEPGPQTAVVAKKSLATNAWTHRSDAFQMKVQTTVEFDGCVDYRILLKAEKPLTTKNVSLDIPMHSNIAEYFMGLGQRGGYAPKQVQWKWDVDRVTNKLWAGNAAGGLVFDMMHSRDLWPVANNYRAWGTPPSWDNSGQGGCDFTRDTQVARIHAYTGARSWRAGEEVEFHFKLLVTPFKPIDMKQFRYRYCSKEQRHWAEGPEGPKIGCNIAHTHHAMGGINPWINYPFLTIDAMKEYRNRLLTYGYQDMDVYYTLREISNHMSEIWALRSLDDEIFDANEALTYDEQGGRVIKGGGGYSWLQEHLLTGYAPAWSVGVDGTVDAAIATQGLGRLHNSYVEGLDLLMQRVGFKGLYLDGIGYNRQVMQRVARVMAKNTPDYRIKVHCGNTFDYAGWRCNSMLHYAENLPYVTDLYIGEGYNYSATPDYWFVEMSGIPFGLTNEMLGGGNPWRGMVFGMDSRDNGVSQHLWKLWDAFGIEQATMIGYWDKQCPVKTNHPEILATVYRHGNKTMVALASWAPEPHMCRLAIDWKVLGLDPRKTRLFAPEIPGFQPAAMADSSAEIPVMPGRGFLLMLDEEPRTAPPFQIPNAYAGRTVLLKDSFDREQLGEPWAVRVSGKSPTSLKIDRNSLAISAPASCYAFAERPLPADCDLVECMVFSGTDGGASWGPGMSLVWKQNVFRINLRADHCFGVDDGGPQRLVGKVSPNTWYRIRIRLEKEELLVESSIDGRLWWPLLTQSRKGYEGAPIAVRLGKMDSRSEAADFSTPGPVGESAIKELQVYGISNQ